MDNIFKTVATPVTSSVSVPDTKSNTGKRLTLECRDNAVGWYCIFREIALECPDFVDRRSRKSIKGNNRK